MRAFSLLDSLNMTTLQQAEVRRIAQRAVDDCRWLLRCILRFAGMMRREKTRKKSSLAVLSRLTAAWLGGCRKEGIDMITVALILASAEAVSKKVNLTLSFNAVKPQG